MLWIMFAELTITFGTLSEDFDQLQVVLVELFTSKDIILNKVELDTDFKKVAHQKAINLD